MRRLEEQRTGTSKWIQKNLKTYLMKKLIT
jgi:hypothetical protein